MMDAALWLSPLLAGTKPRTMTTSIAGRVRPSWKPGQYHAYHPEDANEFLMGRPKDTKVAVFYDKMSMLWVIDVEGPVLAPAQPTTNCINCGAPVTSTVCAYCGTHH